MDLPLLHNLQTIKRIEDEFGSEFDTDNYDIATFKPMYPNVMIVDQSFDKNIKREKDVRPVALSPTHSNPNVFSSGSDKGPVRLQVITNDLSGALGAIINPRLSSYKGGWSVVLKEGLYIDPLGLPISKCQSLIEGIEIVGLKNVRILAAKRIFPTVMAARVTDVTLRNIRIYDLRENPRQHLDATISSEFGARLNLVRVRVTSPFIRALFVDEGSFASLKSSTLANCRSAFAVQGAELHFEDCSVLKIAGDGYSASTGSKLSAVRTRFVNHQELCITSGSQLLVDDCQFVNDRNWLPYSTRVTGVSVALQIQVRSILSCRRTSFRGYDQTVTVQGSSSKATLKDCDVTSLCTTITARENASTTVSDCVIDAPYLMMVSANAKGKIEISRNRFTHSKYATPSVLIDKVSKKPRHDVEGLVFETKNIVATNPSGCAKVRSEYTLSVKNKVRDQGAKFDVCDMEFQYKRCENCMIIEDDSAFNKWMSGKPASSAEKFQYCGKCREACYCSKACQITHWPDHRLTCSGSKRRSS